MANELCSINEVVKEFLELEARICEENSNKPGTIISAMVEAWNDQLEETD
jgi:hypothetical protein